MVRGPVSLAVVAAITLVMFLFVAMGPRAFERVLPERAMLWLETAMNSTIRSMDGGAWYKGNPSEPMSYVDSTNRAPRVTGPILVTDDGGAAMILDVIEGRLTGLAKDSPAKLVRLEPAQACLPVPPSAGAVFRHIVLTGNSGHEIGLSTYGEAELARGVQALVDEIRGRKSARLSDMGWYPWRSFDVAVTETARPVYLVAEVERGYQSWDASRILNFHLAPGATVERVVLIGGLYHGVAGLPEEVPVEIFPAAHLAKCGAAPTYVSEAAPGEKGGPSKMELPGGLPESMIEEAKDRQEAWNEAARAWRARFHEMFGHDPTVTAVGRWDDLTAALIGPLPAEDARLAWTPIAGARVRLSADTYLETYSDAKGETGYRKRVEAIAAAFAGGDLAAIAAEGTQ
ncbi:hypothetical protein [Pseudogemmobacter humi]|uniref:Uncharacterized protein n=1 Tax=Pseudogemmobacter humi TaxID=2483812 RepID=A0A3P5X6T2_9RHOB|nr:hypothetical protein [Pseudogemmobacter humi]VDC30049.1 hypothetical protein XINFAN_02410 [Pseudogemmobacter humi]